MDSEELIFRLVEWLMILSGAGLLAFALDRNLHFGVAIAVVLVVHQLLGIKLEVRVK